MIRKLSASISLCGLLLAGAGCMSTDQMHNFYPHANSVTMTQNGRDHHNFVLKVLSHDKLSLIDDLDVFFMTERPSRLNRWHSK